MRTNSLPDVTMVHPIIPIPETTRLQADSPYGKTKAMVENIIDSDDYVPFVYKMVHIVILITH